MVDIVRSMSHVFRAAARAAFFRDRRSVSNSADGTALESKCLILGAFAFCGGARTRSPCDARLSVDTTFGGARAPFGRLRVAWLSI